MVVTSKLTSVSQEEGGNPDWVQETRDRPNAEGQGRGLVRQ